MKKSLDIITIGLVSSFLLVLAAITSLGMLNPEKASVGFGMAISDEAGALFYRVFASRNFLIVAAGAIFLFTRQWKPLAILVTLTSGLAVFDMAVLTTQGITPPRLHPLILALILVTSVFLWRRVFANESGDKKNL